MIRKHKGTVESMFLGAEEEILHDLRAVIESSELKPVRLTKSGIPPKPLWNAINQRLIWKDPQSLLYDWEEVDQVRFVYLLARELDLVRPDADGWLQRGSGADQFFLASTAERARLLRRSYLNIWDWDERCDARDQAGCRHNFGKAYRRDFVHDVTALRTAAFEVMTSVPSHWVATSDLAKQLSGVLPDLLISEVGEVPELDDSGIDIEKLRFVNYWFTLLTRFGWADMGRAPGSDPDARLCRLPPLGLLVSKGKAIAEDGQGGLVCKGKTLKVSETVGTTDRYVAARLSGEAAGLASFTITKSSLAAAQDTGLDLGAAKKWLEQFVAGDISTLTSLIQTVQHAKPDVRIVRNVVAVEIDPGDRASKKAITKLGFSIEGGLAIAAGVDIPVLFDAVGGEPDEGFDYPLEDALAAWKAGPSLHFHYEAMPLPHRDLILALGAEGCPPVIQFTPDKIAALAEQGWGLETLCTALAELAQKAVPMPVRGLFAEVLS